MSISVFFYFFFIFFLSLLSLTVDSKQGRKPDTGNVAGMKPNKPNVVSEKNIIIPLLLLHFSRCRTFASDLLIFV
jgi:hypothetical protein